jgi:hypothetical protein
MGKMKRTVNVHLRGGGRIAFATDKHQADRLWEWFQLPKGTAHTITGTSIGGHAGAYTFSADGVDAVWVQIPDEAA